MRQEQLRSDRDISLLLNLYYSVGATVRLKNEKAESVISTVSDFTF